MIYFTDEEFAQAACKDMDVDIFYADDRKDIYHFRNLKQLCATCPIIFRCLEVAVANNEHGFWGGMTEEERKRLKRKPYRTPAKHAHIERQIQSGAARIRADLERGYELTKDTLPANTRRLVELRLEDSTLSLVQLGAMVSPALRKDQVYGKLRTIASKGREAAK